MKKKVIAGLSLVVIALYTLLYLFSKPESVYEADMETDIIVQEGVAQSEPLVSTFEIPEDGEYTMHAEWEISPEGMLMACCIRDESGEAVNNFSAECITMMSGSMQLKAGEYTMTLTPLTDAEQWKEYFAGFDTSDWDVSVEESEPEYAFATDGEFYFDFDFKVQTYVDLDWLGIVLAAAVAVLLIVILLAMTQKGEGLKQDYDERQEVLRGKGARYAFYTMMIQNFVLFTLEAAEMYYLPMSIGYALFLSTLIGIVVYAVYCIWNEAYFALNQNANTLTVVFLAMGIGNLWMGIDAFAEGVAIQNEQLTLRSMNLFCGIMILIICGALIIKKICKDREED